MLRVGDRRRARAPSASSRSSTASAVVNAESTTATPLADDRLDDRAQQRVVRAAEQQRVDPGIAGQQRLEIGAQHASRHAGPSRMPASTIGTSSGQASCATRVSGAASTIASGYAPDSTVPAVAMTATCRSASRRRRRPRRAARRRRPAPSSARGRASSARAVAVLQASTSSFTSWAQRASRPPRA